MEPFVLSHGNRHGIHHDAALGALAHHAPLEGEDAPLCDKDAEPIVHGTVGRARVFDRQVFNAALVRTNQHHAKQGSNVRIGGVLFVCWHFAARANDDAGRVDWQHVPSHVLLNLMLPGGHVDVVLRWQGMRLDVCGRAGSIGGADTALACADNVFHFFAASFASFDDCLLVDHGALEAAA